LQIPGLIFVPRCPELKNGYNSFEIDKEEIGNQTMMAKNAFDRIELDLHGFTVDDALARFVNFYNQELLRGSGRSIRVIHGWGSSGSPARIRKSLRRLLDRNSERLEYLPGKVIDPNDGSTLVFPGKVLPSRSTDLGEKILSYCNIPRTMRKITGEFHRTPQPEILRAIKILVRENQLQVKWKGKNKVYLRAGG
jgi:hypothetical protein